MVLFQIHASSHSNSCRYVEAEGEAAKAEFMMDGVTPVPDDIVPLETNVVGNYAARLHVHSHSLPPHPLPSAVIY